MEKWKSRGEICNEKLIKVMVEVGKWAIKTIQEKNHKLLNVNRNFFKGIQTTRKC